jgi:hypothetical protein
MKAVFRGARGVLLMLSLLIVTGAGWRSIPPLGAL